MLFGCSVLNSLRFSREGTVPTQETLLIHSERGMQCVLRYPELFAILTGADEFLILLFKNSKSAGMLY